MRSERFAAGQDATGLAMRLRGLIPAPASVSATVAEIIECVRLDGDGAVEDYTERFDTGGAPAAPLRVPDGAIAQAEQDLDPAVRHGLTTAFAHVHAAAAAGLRPPRTELTDGCRTLILRSEPVDRAAVYVPGGRAPYPSTVVMGVAAARAAGVREVVVAARPDATAASTRSCSAHVASPASARCMRWVAPRRSRRWRMGPT